MSHLPRHFEGVPVVWAETPFGKPQIRAANEGLSVAEIVATTPNLPEAFATIGIAVIGGVEVPRHLWRFVRPRADRGEPVVVQLGLKLSGGGDGGGKSGLRTAAMIALLVAAVAVGQFEVLTALGTIGTIGTHVITGAELLAAGLTVGALAIGALSPPPTFDTAAVPPGGVQQGSAALTGNVLQPGGSVPQVIGCGMRVFPPLAAQVLNERVGLDDYAEAIFLLNGPHKITDIRLGNTAIEQYDDIEYEVREGLPGDAARALISRLGYTQQLGAVLARPRVNEQQQDLLSDQVTPSNSMPSWLPAACRQAPDEIWLPLQIQGMVDGNAYATQQAIPFRVQFRQRGSLVWMNCPEIHVASPAGGSPFELTLKFMFQPAPVALPQAPSVSGAWLAYKTVPAQSFSPSTGAWGADDWFSAGAGGDLYSSATPGAHKVRNIALFSDRAEIYLDPAVFPKGVYEIRVMQGAMYPVPSWNATNYAWGGSVYDLFGYRISGAQYLLPRSRAQLQDQAGVGRVVSVWNETPVIGGDFATLAIRVKNQSLGQVSVNAAAYIPIWNGAEWGGLSVSESPADHYRNVLTGAMNRRAIPVAIVDDADLTEWHAHCAARGLTVNAVLDNNNVLGALDLIASCGYARRRNAEKFGVMVDRYRGYEAPVMAFTPRNLSELSWTKSLGDLPDGYRVNFRDAANDFQQSSIVVLRPGATDTGRYEDINNDGMVDEADAIARATFDLRQLSLRMTFYSGSTNLQHLSVRRGSLVALSHDILSRRNGSARIAPGGVLRSGSQIIGFLLDGTIPLSSDDAWSNSSAAWSSYSAAWAAPRYGLMIARIDGSVSVHEIALSTLGEDTAAMLVTPIADPGPAVIDAGCIVASGPLGREYKRVYVTEIQPRPDMTAQITFVDEAPGLFNPDGTINLN